MDVFITEKESGAQVALAMLPEKVKRKGSAKFQSYDIVQVGEVKVPRGTKLLTFSWSGRFPGASRRTASFVKTQHWQEPKEMVAIFERWRKEHTRLTLMVTETAINNDVYLQDFTSTDSGGAGDITYDATFIEAKDIKVYTTAELNMKPAAKVNETTTTTRPTPPPAKTYTVKKGDSLWAIAKKELGSGARYTEIYSLNKDTIGKNPNLIYPGQVFTLPG